MNKLNIGILGCANIAERFVIPSIISGNKFSILGVASRNRDKANSFSDKFDIPPFYSYQSLIACKDLHAIYIPLPNSLHYEWIKRSLKMGLHVLVEKSMACSYQEVIELNEIAKESNLVLIENFQFRFHSQLQSIRNLIIEGEIGELRNISSFFGFPPFSDKNNIRYQKELGGGALLDAGAYPLKITQLFLGSEIYVDSASLAFQDGIDVDIWGSAFLKQKFGKVTSQIAFGFDNFYRNSIELWGTKGKIRANRIFTAGPGFQPSIDLETTSKVETILLEADNHFVKMLDYFYDKILDRYNLEDEYKQNIRQAKLIDELKNQAGI